MRVLLKKGEHYVKPKSVMEVQYVPQKDRPEVQRYVPQKDMIEKQQLDDKEEIISLSESEDEEEHKINSPESTAVKEPKTRETVKTAAELKAFNNLTAEKSKRVAGSDHIAESKTLAKTESTEAVKSSRKRSQEKPVAGRKAKLIQLTKKLRRISAAKAKELEESKAESVDKTINDIIIQFKTESKAADVEDFKELPLNVVADEQPTAVEILVKTDKPKEKPKRIRNRKARPANILQQPKPFDPYSPPVFMSQRDVHLERLKSGYYLDPQRLCRSLFPLAYQAKLDALPGGKSYIPPLSTVTPPKPGMSTFGGGIVSIGKFESSLAEHKVLLDLNKTLSVGDHTENRINASAFNNASVVPSTLPCDVNSNYTENWKKRKLVGGGSDHVAPNRDDSSAVLLAKYLSETEGHPLDSSCDDPRYAPYMYGNSNLKAWRGHNPRSVAAQMGYNGLVSDMASWHEDSFSTGASSSNNDNVYVSGSRAECNYPQAGRLASNASNVITNDILAMGQTFNNGISVNSDQSINSGRPFSNRQIVRGQPFNNGYFNNEALINIGEAPNNGQSHNIGQAYNSGQFYNNGQAYNNGQSFNNGQNLKQAHLVNNGQVNNGQPSTHEQFNNGASVHNGQPVNNGLSFNNGQTYSGPSFNDGQMFNVQFNNAQPFNYGQSYGNGQPYNNRSPIRPQINSVVKGLAYVNNQQIGQQITPKKQIMQTDTELCGASFEGGSVLNHQVPHFHYTPNTSYTTPGSNRKNYYGM